MAVNSSTLLTPSNPKAETESPADYSPLLLLPVAMAVAFHYSKKELRKAKKKMVWQLMKLKLKTMFSMKGKKEMSPGLKLILIAVLAALAFGLIFSPAVGGIVLVVALLFVPILVRKGD